MNLTDEQIEQAAKTIYEALNTSSGYIWPPNNEHMKAIYLDLAERVAMFLQAPWYGPNDNEVQSMLLRCRSEGHGLPAHVARLALKVFIDDRNAMMVFKPVDPRVEQVREFLLHHDRRPETLTETSRGIIALLDSCDKKE